MSVRALRLAVGAVLLAASTMAAGWYCLQALQTKSDAPFTTALARLNNVTAPSATITVPDAPAIGEPIGLLEIPRLGISGLVVQGDDDTVLERGIGHLPDTPLPWQDGNSAIAAHRTTVFAPLKDIHAGDTLLITTPHGDIEYRVSETMIVRPEDLWVLDATPHPSLTLITCYPFNFIGSAPKRFIVRAERTESDVAS